MKITIGTYAYNPAANTRQKIAHINLNTPNIVIYKISPYFFNIFFQVKKDIENLIDFSISSIFVETCASVSD